MAMVMYLFTCGFVCDNSNVYSNKKQTKKVMCIVTVTKCSEAHIRGYITAMDHKMRLMQLFPLGLHSHGMTATHLFEQKVLQGC